jgi:hypothetical protein
LYSNSQVHEIGRRIDLTLAVKLRDTIKSIDSIGVDFGCDVRFASITGLES